MFSAGSLNNDWQIGDKGAPWEQHPLAGVARYGNLSFFSFEALVG